MKSRTWNTHTQKFRNGYMVIQFSFVLPQVHKENWNLPMQAAEMKQNLLGLD
jgi:hypothetical protein